MLKLREARRRLALASFLRVSPWALLVGLGILVLGRAGLAVQGSLSPLSANLVGFALGVPLLAAALSAAWWWRSLEVVAREVDRRTATKDRFSTFLSLKDAGPSEFGALSAREIASYVSTLRLDHTLRPAAPKKSFLWLLLPIAGLVALTFLDEARRAAVAPELAKAAALLQKARDAATRQPEPSPAAIKDIEAALERVKSSNDPWKEAMSALADLENKLSANSAAQAGLTPEESAALAAAVAAENPELARQLRAGNQAEAARELSKMDPAAVKQAMEQAEQHLESNRLRDLARQQAGAAQRSLAQIMRSAGAPESGGEGKRQLVAALQDAKSSALGDTSQGDASQGQAPDSPNGKNPANPGKADDAPPGGAAGSDKDSGKGADLAGARDPKQAPEAQDDSLAGIQGTGASLVETFRAAGNDDPAAQRAYRAAYQTAVAATLDSINHEEIPAGSRLLVKRYFDSIRPAE